METPPPRAPLTSHNANRPPKSGEIGEFWRTNDGAVRLMLENHVRNGRAETKVGRDGRRVYALTKAGKAELAAWASAPDVNLRPHRDELMVRALYVTEFEGRVLAGPGPLGISDHAALTFTVGDPVGSP